MTKPITVETTSGPVIGEVGQAVSSFLGIPYGAVAPGRRFQPALPPRPWTEPRSAVAPGPSCFQTPIVLPPHMPEALRESLAAPGTSGEDCLSLNVWTPAPDDRARPVMVWLHGGAFSSGVPWTTVTDGAALADAGDVIVVSIGQRLNLFGYLYLAEIGGDAYADSGNAGNLDLVLALQWIRDNIRRFGGDPDNVTLFGQSGGGSKICTLMAMPAAKGLFHKAIMQSGPMMLAIEPARATDSARCVLDALGIAPEEVDRIQDCSVPELLAAYEKAVDAGFYRVFAPVIDNRSLFRHPFQPDAPAEAEAVSLMVGFGDCETTLSLPQQAHFQLTWDSLAAHLAPHLQGAAPDPVIAAARQARPDASPSDLFFEVTTLLRFQRTSLEIAGHKARQAAPVYVYELAWSTPVQGGRWRSPHTLDIPLVFRTTDAAAELYEPGSGASEISDQMSMAWAAFAHTGDPTHPGIPTWPRYDAEAAATMVFDTPPHVAMGPLQALSQALADVPNWHFALADAGGVRDLDE